jgi:hypothetical protein
VYLSPEYLALLKEKKVLLEMCPTSNFQTGTVKTLAEYKVTASATFLPQPHSPAWSVNGIDNWLAKANTSSNVYGGKSSYAACGMINNKP